MPVLQNIVRQLAPIISGQGGLATPAATGDALAASLQVTCSSGFRVTRSAIYCASHTVSDFCLWPFLPLCAHNCAACEIWSGRLAPPEILSLCRESRAWLLLSIPDTAASRGYHVPGEDRWA